MILKPLQDFLFCNGFLFVEAFAGIERMITGV